MRRRRRGGIIDWPSRVESSRSCGIWFKSKREKGTDLVEHEELGVALVQVVLLPAHLDVHVVDGVPARRGVRDKAKVVRFR